jgi:hypothetical protein
LPFWQSASLFGRSLIAFLLLIGWDARQTFRAAPENQTSDPVSAPESVHAT